MKNFFLYSVLSVLIILQACCSGGYGPDYKVLDVAEGWAKTSVNATIFRKNSVVSNDRFQYTSWYDSTGFVVVAKRSLGSEEWEVRRTQMEGNVADAHNVISIMLDKDGFLHLAWDHHNGALKYCRSTAPDALEFTGQLSMTGKMENTGVSYPEFYKLPNGDLLFAYRYGGSGGGNLVLNLYDSDTKEWLRLHDNLIDGQGERNAYWQMCVDDDGVLHISWVWRESWDVFTNHDLCYARSLDGGHTWQSSDGNNLNIPVNAQNAEYALQIPQGSSLINQTSMIADQDGHPYIVSYWTPPGEEVPQFFLVFLREGQWNVSQVTNRTLPFSLKGEGSRRIPVSRPQVVVSDKNKKIHVVFRDREYNNRICIASTDLNSAPFEWNLKTIPGIEVGQWEPSFDTEMWNRKEELHLFVQNVGQGEGNENPEEMAPQMVKILVFSELGN